VLNYKKIHEPLLLMKDFKKMEQTNYNENDAAPAKLLISLLEHSAKMKMHPVFSEIHSIQGLREFMSWHVFAVLDFMSLVKRLQHEFTTLTLPWTPPLRPAAARLLNEIVLGEESDLTPSGVYCSHFDLYILAMKEVGADCSKIEQFIDLIKANIPVESALKMIHAPKAIMEFVQSTIFTAQHGTVAEVLGSFLYGREDAIPQMFKTLLSEWSVPESETPTFVYYLQRHIELDGDSHGPAATMLAQEVVQKSEGKQIELYSAGLRAIEHRIALWDALQLHIHDIEKIIA
jgi:hypothetical protein